MPKRDCLSVGFLAARSYRVLSPKMMYGGTFMSSAFRRRQALSSVIIFSPVSSSAPGFSAITLRPSAFL